MKTIGIFVLIILLCSCSATIPPLAVSSPSQSSTNMQNEKHGAEPVDTPPNEPSEHSPLEIIAETTATPVYTISFSSDAWVPAYQFISRIGMTVRCIGSSEGSSSFEKWQNKTCIYGYEYFQDDLAEVVYLVSIYDLPDTGAHLSGEEPCSGILTTLSKMFPQVADCDGDEIIAFLSDTLEVAFEWVNDEDTEKNWIYFCKFSNEKDMYSFIIYAEPDGTLSAEHGVEIIIY